VILAAAVCPHPPMLVPEVASGAADDMADLREACDDVVASLIALEPDRIVVLGTGELAVDVDESAGGTLAGFGVDVRAGGATDELPLSLTIGAWLLDRAGWSGPRTYSTGEPGTEGRVALLVMADGSAKRATEAPGFFDERAEAFDAAISAALATGDAATLADLDLALGAELWAAGTPALRTLGRMTKDAAITPRLRSDTAPFGVGYWVADWVLS
jgi:aromatic ring-opening dioxygenase LigB subunit